MRGSSKVSASGVAMKLPQLQEDLNHALLVRHILVAAINYASLERKRIRRSLLALCAALQRSVGRAFTAVNLSNHQLAVLSISVVLNLRGRIP